MKYWIFLLVVVIGSGCAVKKNVGTDVQISYERIWSEAPHSAFTDLIRYKGKFYCAFREAPGHVSGPKGTARVISSADGKTWSSVAHFKMEGLDLRDPKLSITPDNQLMVLIDVESYRDNQVETRKPYVSFSTNGTDFSAPFASAIDPAVAEKSDWVWRVTWDRGVGYAIDYQHKAIHLLKTNDGKSFQQVSNIPVSGYPNESTIRFDQKGKIYVLIRREQEDKMGVLATSEAPYQNWTFHKLTERIGGPNFIFLNDSTLCIGSRQYIPNPPGAEKEYKKYITSLFITDLNGKIKKTIPFEKSLGDTSYPGLVVYQGQLWVSYYSSHEEKTAIYLAKIPLNLLKP
ncbi:MAG: sialidase family protein [Pedobacter sp.]|nr:sialidase family protein [Pedobacter sp.]MDQ8052189.1 sialidase family protein [Pedobacter sp.]